MSGHRCIADLIPDHCEGQFMTRLRHSTSQDLRLEVPRSVQHELRIELNDLDIVFYCDPLVRPVESRQIILCQPAWQEQVAVFRDALVTLAVRPANQETGSRNNVGKT